MSFVFLFLNAVGASSAHADDTVLGTKEARLKIKVGSEVREFTRADLLRLPELKQMKVDSDPTYPRAHLVYDAVPLAVLFKGLNIDQSGSLNFVCQDGFSAPMPAARLLNRDPKGSIAYLAVENPSSPWPHVKSKGPSPTAGPFTLIWENPKASKISGEEWPFQLVSFESSAPIEAQYPHISPEANVPEDSSIRKGYGLFKQNCFVCHTMNGEGSSALGPDLNIPYSPTEYLLPGFIEKLVRNPQDVRHWPQSKMSHFDKTALSDADLTAIISYLEHKAKHKVATAGH